MKRLLLMSWMALTVSLLIVVPALAYTGVEGTVVDDYGDPWAYGGDVYILDPNTGTLYAECELSVAPASPVGEIVDSSGAVCDYGDGPNAPYATPTNFSQVEVYIVPNESSVTGDAPGPMSKTYRELTSSNSSVDVGIFYTGTGPNAVTFSNFGGTSGLALALVLPLAVLGGVVYRKRRQQ